MHPATEALARGYFLLKFLAYGETYDGPWQTPDGAPIIVSSFAHCPTCGLCVCPGSVGEPCTRGGETVKR